jgi:hypothetical protein
MSCVENDERGEADNNAGLSRSVAAIGSPRATLHLGPEPSGAPTMRPEIRLQSVPFAVVSVVSAVHDVALREESRYALLGGAPGCPISIRFRFELVQARVVVRELLEVRPSDLPRERQVVVRNVCLWVPSAMFQFHLY